MGDRRDQRRLIRSLGALALLLILSLTAVEFFHGRRIARLDETWESGERDRRLTDALTGVRDTFTQQVDAASRHARDIAETVDRLGPDSASDREGRFEAMLAIERPPGVAGALLLDDGVADAWSGRVFEIGTPILDAVASGEAATLFLRSAIYQTIVAVQPTARPGRGVVVFLPFDVRFPLHSRYLGETGFASDLAERFGVSNVRITEPFEVRPYENRIGDRLEASLGIEGRERALAGVEIIAGTLMTAKTKVGETHSIARAALGGVLALTIAAIVLVIVAFGPLRDRLGPAARAAISIAIVAALRLVFQWVGFPRQLGPDSLYQTEDFGTDAFWGLLESPGDLLLTSIAAGTAAAILARLATVWRRRTPDRWRRPVVRVSGGIVALGGLVFAVGVYASAVRTMAFQSTLDHLDVSTLVPSGPALVMLLALFFLTAALVLVATPALFLVANGIGVLLPRARGFRTLIAATGLFALLLLGERTNLEAFTAALVFGGGAALLASGRVSRYPSWLGLIALFGSILAFVFFGRAVWQEREADVAAAARDVARQSHRDQEFFLGGFLSDAAERPGVIRVLSEPAGPDDAGEAFRLWADSRLGRAGVDCDVELVLLDGTVRSRWEIRMPPKSWLPPFDATPSTEDILQVRLAPGREDGADREFLVGSGPVLDRDDAVVGRVRARVPVGLYPDARPEILRRADRERATGPFGLRFSRFERGELIETNDVDRPRSRRPPSSVDRAIAAGADEVWVVEEVEGRRVHEIYVPVASGQSGEGLVAMAFDAPRIREATVFLLRFLLVNSGVALLLIIGHLLLRLRHLQLRFQHKLLATFIVLSALPVALLAWFESDLAEERYREALEGRLRESLESIARRLREGGQRRFEARFPDLRTAPPGATAPESNEWCKREGIGYNRDINIYLDDRLRASSEPGVFRTELFSDRLSGRAYVEIVLRRRDVFFDREFAGDYAFLAGYTALLDPEDESEVIGALAIPMFWRQDELNADLASQNATLASIYLLALIAIIFAGIEMARRISLPLERLTEGTRRLGAGDLDWRIPSGSRDEFGDLVASFNQMASTLADSREALVKAEKDAAWREMAKQVAHEIKNPLTPMKLSAQQILRAWEDKHVKFPEILKRSCETIDRQVENLRRIATDFADFARIARRPRREVDVNAVADEVRLLYAGHAERGVRIAVTLDPAVPSVHADAEDLKRVLINLVQNAVGAYGSKSGEIRIVTAPTVARFEGEERPFAEITVSDDAGGIPAHLVARVFEPNFSTRSGGTGLGLAICRQIVESLDGRIDLESAEGAGTTVTVRLPG